MSRFLKRVAVKSSACVLIFKTYSFRFLHCSESHFRCFESTLRYDSNAHIVTRLSYLQKFVALTKLISCYDSTAVPGFRVLGFCALPGFRALKAGDGAWSVHKTLIGFRALLSQLLIKKMSLLNKTQVKFT